MNQGLIYIEQDEYLLAAWSCWHDHRPMRLGVSLALLNQMAELLEHREARADMLYILGLLVLPVDTPESDEVHEVHQLGFIFSFLGLHSSQRVFLLSIEQFFV